MPTGQQLVDNFKRYLGTTYKFGGEEGDCADANNVDCSEGVEWACRCTGVTPTMPDGSGNQFSHCDAHGGRLDFSQAKGIVGALIFKAYDNSASNYPPGDRNNGKGIYHVAMVAGPNLTMEICCDDGDKVVQRNIDGRAWYAYGCKVPGVSYDSAPTTPPTQPPTSNEVPVSLGVEEGGTVSLRELRKGLTGRDVREVQAMLSEWGISPGTHDGDFGSNTDSAVRTFQSSRGLGVDGIVGAKTYTSLFGR